ncbi:FecR domain-containing protein [Brevundimonas sp.]|uniref:FecR family protein n=1 Tax=Brevundimonas sp. TaxID=1871086 RepID=UPI0027314C39|nr:FecR family protein [Brevundimonas sp.]MDP1913299.1 FecR domain-containing protein [Brevundimonas sp.]
MNQVRTLVAAAAMACAVLAAPTVEAQEAVGVNAAIRNSIRTQPAGESALRPAALRGQVRTGDVFVSGAQSQLQILLRDQSIFTVGSNARVTIDRFVIDTDRNAAGASAAVARGAFRFVSGRGGARPGAVRTPVASIGVRGTVLEAVVGPDALFVLEGHPGLPPFAGSPDEATLIVLRGPGPRGSGFDTPGAIDVTSGGSTFIVERPGQAMFAWAGGAFGPFELSDQASARLSSLLRAAPSSNTDSGPGDVLSASIDSGDAAFFGARGPGGPDTIEPTVKCLPAGGQNGPPSNSPPAGGCDARPFDPAP